jgi:hypothetical protein
MGIYLLFLWRFPTSWQLLGCIARTTHGPATYFFPRESIAIGCAGLVYFVVACELSLGFFYYSARAIHQVRPSVAPVSTRRRTETIPRLGGAETAKQVALKHTRKVATQLHQLESIAGPHDAGY